MKKVVHVFFLLIRPTINKDDDDDDGGLEQLPGQARIEEQSDKGIDMHVMSVTVKQLVHYQDPDTEAATWNLHLSFSCCDVPTCLS